MSKLKHLPNGSNIVIQDADYYTTRSLTNKKIGIKGRYLDDILKDIVNIVEKNLEAGLLINWNTKVKDTKLARKMYKNYIVKDGWLYVEDTTK